MSRAGYRATTIDRAGLPRAVVITMPHARTAVVEVFVRAGSAYETSATNGISHLLEHVVCAGTDRYPTRSALQLAIDQTGGMLEAFTHKELTEFVFHVIPSMVPRALELLGEAIVRSTVASDVVESERQIVLEEMLEGSHEGAHDPFSELMWGTSSLGLPIIGKRAVIESLSRDDLLRFKRQMYTVDAMLVCVAGAVDEDVVVKGLEAFRGAPPPPTVPVERETAVGVEGQRYYIERFGAATVDATLLLRSRAGPESGHRQTALSLFAECYQAHVYQQLVGPRLPVYYLGAGYQRVLDQGCVYIYMKVHRSRFEETMEKMLDELDRMRRDGVAEDQLDLSKRRHELRMLADVIDPRYVAGRVGADLLLHGDDGSTSVDAELMQLGHVDSATLRAATDELFCQQNLYAVVRGGLSWWGQRRFRRRIGSWLR